MPLTLGALGVVFGDIGTSPLYAFQQVFVGDSPMAPASASVYGVLSLIFWTLTLVVSVKYVLIAMRADNDGEGGIMALAALTQRHVYRHKGVAAGLMLLGVVGASLFYGDSMITPAVSVMSAVEGLEVVDPDLAVLVIPLSVVILLALFGVQRWGTARLGAAFGPVMLLWFGCIGVLGLLSVLQTPEVLRSISPTYAVAFLTGSPMTAFFALGSVILCVTGAEALYADMGHFGRSPIRRAWFVITAPALYLNSLGQGALVLRDAEAADNPFYKLVPGALMLPMVVLATLATVIASQAVITGAFSMTQQAIRLHYLPRLTVLHTSARARGQIYVPAVNWMLMIAVIGLVIGFRDSSNLASAYGLAVSGTFFITTCLIIVVARTRWRTPAWILIPGAVLFLAIDGAFVAANLTKIDHGGWFPLAVAAVIFTVLTTWARGRVLLGRQVAALALSDQALRDLVSGPQISTMPGTAVYVSFDDRVPLALAQYVQLARVFRADTVQLQVETRPVPRVPDDRRFTVTQVFPGFTRITMAGGFMERTDVARAVRLIRDQGLYPIPSQAVFVVRAVRVHPSGNSGMMSWRKHLYAFMLRNAADPAAALRLDDRHVIEFTSVVRL